MLNEKEVRKYLRQIVLPEIGNTGQEKLKNAKVLVVGAGGLGCPALQYLGAAGIGTLGIVDYDVVDETNLHRQVLFSEEEVGKNKTEIASQKLFRQNPECKLQTFTCQLSPANATEIIRQYDLVIDSSDNFPTRYLVNDACVILNKPFVSGSVFRFEGQVSVFNYNNGPTYRCLFPEPPQDTLNCSEAGVMGVLCGVIGTLMTNEAVKIITGAGEVLSGKLLLFDALKNSFQTITFSKVEDNGTVRILDDYGDFCSVKQENVREISAEELKKMLAEGKKIQMIDVREPAEHASFNIHGINIPLQQIAGRSSEIRRDVPVIIYCQLGNRSRKAVEILQTQFGFTNLFSLKNGIRGFIPSEFSIR